jgi:threonine synthase
VENCAPIVRAFQNNERHAALWENASTIAAGMRVPVAIGDYLILDAIRASGGTAITVTDDELREGMHLAATQEGMFVSPESGAAIIAARKLREQRFLNVADEVVIFSTGSGLMHTDLVAQESMTIVDPADTGPMWERWAEAEPASR